MRGANQRQPKNQRNAIIITDKLNGNMKEEEGRKTILITILFTQFGPIMTYF